MIVPHHPTSLTFPKLSTVITALNLVLVCFVHIRVLYYIDISSM